MHWGTFNLAFHAWDEPVEELLIALVASDVRVALPAIGQSLIASEPGAINPWWRVLRAKGLDAAVRELGAETR